MAFDGTNVWIANQTSNTDTEFQAATQTVVASFAAGTNPQTPVNDGTNIWAAGLAGARTQINATTGAIGVSITTTARRRRARCTFSRLSRRDLVISFNSLTPIEAFSRPE
jgi:hypothetical protein